MKIDFEPTGKLTVKKHYHYICIALAVILPIVTIILTIVKKTFSLSTLLFCIGIVLVMLVIDYSNRSNMVVYNDEKIALLNMLGSPKVYLWSELSAVYSGSTDMRLEFNGGKKLYINLEYDGVAEFREKLEKIYERNGL